VPGSIGGESVGVYLSSPRASQKKIEADANVE